jgi:hypothetical protein
MTDPAGISSDSTRSATCSREPRIRPTRGGGGAFTRPGQKAEITPRCDEESSPFADPSEGSTEIGPRWNGSVMASPPNRTTRGECENWGGDNLGHTRGPRIGGLGNRNALFIVHGTSLQ